MNNLQVFRSKELVNKVVAAKEKEINLGFDGFLIYDLELVSYMNEVINMNKHY